MLKQRVRHHFHFVKTHALVELSQSCRQRGRNEMDRVTACSKFFAELRSNDAAAAVGGIYRDADVHCALKVASTKPKFNCKKNVRQATLAIACLYLNLTHLLRGGASEERSIFLLSKFSNDSCNPSAAFV